MEAMMHKARPEGVIGGDLVVRGNLQPLPGSRGTGEILPDGRTVYKVPGFLDSSGQYQKRRFTRVLQRDPDGTIQYHLRPDGTKRAPMWTIEPEQPGWVEYVIDDLGNGITKINTLFRESAANIERFRKGERRERELEKLLNALEESNLSVEDVVRAVRGMPPVDDVIVDEQPPTPPTGPERLAAANAARAARKTAASAKPEEPAL